LPELVAAVLIAVKVLSAVGAAVLKLEPGDVEKVHPCHPSGYTVEECCKEEKFIVYGRFWGLGFVCPNPTKLAHSKTITKTKNTFFIKIKNLPQMQK
jgi:hypothetical protein